jgi:disulfide bond formation protein DsbB
MMMVRVISLLSQPRILALFLTAASAGALAFAYIAQYVFNLQPCILCLYQRVPYFVALTLAALAFFMTVALPRQAFYLLLFCGVSFATGAAIAGFHTGVEYKWWAGMDACGDATLPRNATAEEFRAYITQRAIVRCDVPAWTLLGISMTGYNLLLSAFLAAITFFFSIKGRMS